MTPQPQEDQCREHRRRCHGHRIYGATPMSRNDWTNQQLFRECGIGSIVIRGTDMDHYGGTEVAMLAPRTTSRLLPKITELLRPEHKTHAKAGAIGAGGRWTPFRQTCEALAEVVRKTPGIHLAAAIKELASHHYSSDACARSSMGIWAQKGKVPGVRVVVDGRFITLHPAETR